MVKYNKRIIGDENNPFSKLDAFRQFQLRANPSGGIESLRNELEGFKDLQQDLSTPLAEGFDAFYDGSVADIVLGDLTYRALGSETPITDTNTFKFDKFKNQNLSPAEELASLNNNARVIARPDRSYTSFENRKDLRAFEEMLKQGLISDTKGGDPIRIDFTDPNALKQVDQLFMSGNYNTSKLYNESIGNKINKLQNLELYRQEAGSAFAEEGAGEVGKGFLGMGTNLNIPEEMFYNHTLLNTPVKADRFNEIFYLPMPADEDPTKNEEYMSLLKEYSPEKHKKLLKEIRFMETAGVPDAYRKARIDSLVGKKISKGGSDKFVPINFEPADPTDKETFSDMTAAGSKTYAAGQALQLGIEFVPFVGVFDDVTRGAVRLSGSGFAKIFGKDAGKLEIVCGSPCKPTENTTKALNKAVKAGKLTRAQADNILAQGKLKAESKNIAVKKDEAEMISLAGGNKVRKDNPYYVSPDNPQYTKNVNTQNKLRARDEEIVKFIKENPNLNNVKEITAESGFGEKNIYDAITRQNLVGNDIGRMGRIVDEVAARIDFNLGFEENINAIMKALDGQTPFGSAGGSIGSKQKASSMNRPFGVTEGDGITGYDKVKTAVRDEFIKKYQPSVEFYVDQINKIIQSAGRHEPPPEFYANLGRGKVNYGPDGQVLPGKAGFSPYVTREQLKNYDEAMKIVKERMGEKAFKTAWDYNYSYNNFANSLPPDAAAQFLKKQRAKNRGQNRNRQSKDDSDNMKLSGEEGRRFDNVNELWKVDSSMVVARDAKFQEELFNNMEAMKRLGWSTDSNGNLKHAFLKVDPQTGKLTDEVDEGLFNDFKESLLNREFKLGEKSPLTFFEMDHIKEYEKVAKGQQGINLLSNAQIIPARLNQSFKMNAQTFIKKYLSMTPGSDEAIAATTKLNAIIAKANDLGVTLSIGSVDDLKKAQQLGANVDAQYVGYKRVSWEDDAKSQINSYFPTLRLRSLTDGNAEGGTPISRKKFQKGSQDQIQLGAVFAAPGVNPYEQFEFEEGSIADKVKKSLEPVQDQIRSVYEKKLEPYFEPILERGIIKQNELEAELANRLNPPRPVKFKFSELPRLVTQSPLLKNMTTDPKVAGLEAMEFIYNSIRPGVENDIQMEEFFPNLYAINQFMQAKGVQPTPKEQDYISAIDEINRALETGTSNFAFNVGDLLFSVPDAILPTGFTDELKRRYEDTDLSRPETFVGEIGALAVEFGVPSSVAYKLINRFRKFTAAQTGGKVNLFAQQTYGLEGLPKLGVQISNVFKKAGTGAISFGAGDFIAGGPYNIVSEMFDDPLLSSQLVGEYVDTSNLSGKDRVVENFKNRLRFGAEGAMIGGVFPLVGPALGKIGKNVLLKPALFLGGGALKIADTVAIKPVTYLASLDPVVLPGLAQGAGAFAKFLGQDVLARLAATAATGGKAFLPSLRGNYGQLPEFSKWRMFDVTSDDPLEAGLKSVDNFLKWFRDSGNQALYAFNLSGGAERFIKSKAREIEKYLEAIERKAYDLANGFLKRYETGFTSPAGEKNMLDQIHEYLRGNLKLSKIEPELQELAKALKDEFNAIKQAYFKELPEGSGLRAFLETNLDKYMRMSFATFTNPNYTPSAVLLDDATKFMENIIRQNEDFLEAAIRGVDPVNQAEAITRFARKNVENIIQIGKREGIDPINALNKINREILRGDEVFLKTGEELPQVIRNLLGQEKNLRAAVSMTAGSLVSQTANMRAFKEFARHGLENGYLFTSRAEALAAGITDPSAIRSLPGLGPMQELMSTGNGGPIGLFASREMRQTIEGTGGMLDSLLQNSAYQSLIAYKAAVQTGKTVFSPATQTRNFGSASWFPAHVGHIGGGSSVTDAFKIVMDDIFGAGRNVNEVDLIKRIQRKVELGVLDENIVASELGAILKDIKAGKLQSLGQLAQRAENTKFYKQATRVYAGGDNVWKWYGHEYYMSQLKGAFRNIDDVKRFFEDIHGIEYSTKNIMTGANKTLDEGIEEAAAFLLRETYPTYSKVPEFIKAIRKLPIGNFVSFTSEILRTGFATSSVAMKHIASDNRALREMGYRMLTGQAITLGGMTAGAVGLGHALTNVSPTQIEVYKQYFAPDYMKYSTLIPISNHKDGTFKVFDLSRYNPYDIIVSSAKELIKVADKKNYSRDLAALKEQLNNLDPSSAEAFEIRKQMKDLGIRIRMSQRLDPDKIQTSTLKQYLNAVGPLYDAVTGTFFGIPIGAEAFVEAATGRTRQGSPIWSKGMTDTEIFDRAMGHFFKTIEPGIVSSGRKLFYSLRGDVSGVGQPLEINTEIFKLMGGSNVTVDVLGSLDFKISEFQKSFREPKVGKDYYSTENFRSRGPDQLVREYKEQNEQAFRAQYDFYKAAMAAIDSGLITRTQVIAALTNRVSPGSKTVPEKVQALMDGRYTAITYGPEGLKSRREKILRNNPGLDTGRYSIQYFLPFGALENEKSFWNFKRFEDLERALEPSREERQSKTLLKPPVERTVAETEVPELEDSGDPVVGAQAPNVDPATGLTTTETALLSPGEKVIRQRQKGIA